MVKTNIASIEGSNDLLPDPQVARRYKVTTRTLYRWDEQPALGFPKPIRINRRKYRHIKQLEDWERRRAVESDQNGPDGTS